MLVTRGFFFFSILWTSIKTWKFFQALKETWVGKCKLNHKNSLWHAQAYCTSLLHQTLNHHKNHWNKNDTQDFEYIRISSKNPRLARHEKCTRSTTSCIGKSLRWNEICIFFFAFILFKTLICHFFCSLILMNNN